MINTIDETVNAIMRNISEQDLETPFSEVLSNLKEVYETKNKVILKNEDIAKMADMNNDELAYRKRGKKPVGDIPIRNIVELSKSFNIPIAQVITGEDYNYKWTKEKFGLKTNTIEWLKSIKDNTDIDYIGILNIILGNKEIADLLIGIFYTYANTEITKLNQQSLEYESTENIKKALRLAADKNKSNRIKNTEKKVELALKNLKLFSDRADEELQRIETEERQDIEDFDKEVKE